MAYITRTPSRPSAASAPLVYPGAGVAAVQNITYLDEDQLVDAVGLFGPVSIAYQVK